MERARQRLLEAMRQGGWPVTFSIGAVTFPEPPESVDEVIHLTDGVMYAVKVGGKDRVQHQIMSRGSPASTDG